MNIQSIPKAELHCHLDGSISLSTLQKLLPGRLLTQADVQAPARCRDLAQYLERFDLPLQGLQTAENLQTAAHDLLIDMHHESIVYAEIRFAPQLHRRQGLSCQAVIENLLIGLRKAQNQTGGAIRAHLIVCAMRGHTLAQNQEALRAALAYRTGIRKDEPGVCGFDLAGDEAAYPLYEFRELFHAVRAEGLPFTIHAGECGSVENVREAAALGAQRIGHGIALRRDPLLMQQLASEGIGIEMCPTSNLQTQAIGCWEDYPLQSFLQAGLPVSVHTDNRTVSGTTLTQELERVYAACPDEDLIRTLIDNAFQTAFAYR